MSADPYCMSADPYWKRNNTCIDYLKSLVIYKLAEPSRQTIEQEQDPVRKLQLSAQILKEAEAKLTPRAISEEISEQFQKECWSKLEHPEWFETEGHYGSPYYIKPYLALAVKHGLGEQAYKFLNDPTKFPHVNEPPETPIEEKTSDSYGDWTVYFDASNKKWFLHNEKTATDSKLFDHKPTLDEIKEAVTPDEEDIDDDEVEVGDELIDEEGHRGIVVEPKDTSRIPIILTITAKITKRELTPQNQHPISLDINGKAHPYVSSGSDFGAGSSHDTVEEAVKDLNDWIQSQKAWFTESYHRPITVKLETVNDVTTKQQNLQAFF